MNISKIVAVISFLFGLFLIPIGNMFLSFFITSILEFTSFYKVFKEDNRYNVIHVEDRSLWFCKVFVKF